MLIEIEKKEKIISELNHNFRTILSYGEDGGLAPAGEFIIKDIQETETPGEDSNKAAEVKDAKIILTKVDDENVEIILPMATFLTKYSEIAAKNADKFDIESNLRLSLKDIERLAKEKVLNDETLQNLVQGDTISLDESGAKYLINAEVQSSNYSICPVDLGKYRERIIEYEGEERER